jgi:hypothetical protein
MAQGDDLHLLKQFLKQAKDGISLNQLTYHKPTHIEHSDACEHGIGGFSATMGIAWCWEILMELHWQATLNALKYLAGYMTLLMDIHIGNDQQPDGYESPTSMIWILSTSPLLVRQHH